MWYLKLMSHGAQVSTQCRDGEMPLSSEYSTTPPSDLCAFLYIFMQP